MLFPDTKIHDFQMYKDECVEISETTPWHADSFDFRALEYRFVKQKSENSQSMIQYIEGGKGLLRCDSLYAAYLVQRWRRGENIWDLSN